MSERVERMEERLEGVAGRVEAAAEQLQRVAAGWAEEVAEREQNVWSTLGAVEQRLCGLQEAVHRGGVELGASVRVAVREMSREVSRGKERVTAEAAAVREAVARVEAGQVEIGKGVAAAAQGAADTEAAACALSATLRHLGRQVQERQQQERRLEKRLRETAAATEEKRTPELEGGRAVRKAPRNSGTQRRLQFDGVEVEQQQQQQQQQQQARGDVVMEAYLAAIQEEEREAAEAAAAAAAEEAQREAAEAAAAAAAAAATADAANRAQRVAAAARAAAALMYEGTKDLEYCLEGGWACHIGRYGECIQKPLLEVTEEAMVKMEVGRRSAMELMGSGELGREARSELEKKKREAVRGITRAWKDIKTHEKCWGWQVDERVRQQKEMLQQQQQQQQQQEGELRVTVGTDGSVRGTDISSVVGSMMATSKGVGYDGQSFGCAPLHPAM